MATANQVDTLNGIFKEVYADKIKDLIPEGVILYNKIPFSNEGKQTGNLYHQPVTLGLEHGFTYGGTDGSAFNLEAAVAGVMKDAQVQGYEVVLRSQISVGAISRSVSGGKKAFESASKHVVSNMLRSFSRRMEINLMHGKSGLGKVNSVATNVISLKAASWAPGIWAGGEGMMIDIYNGSSKRGSAKVTNVSFDDLSITVDAAPMGTADGDDIFFKGAYGNEFAGIDAIIRNTGTLFNISASAYALWKGNVLGNSGTARDISLSLIEQAVVRSVEKGLAEQDVMALVNPSHWEKLLTEQTAKRSYDRSYSSEKASAGHKKIEFFGQNGLIQVVPSIYCKKGTAYIIPVDEFIRVGSRDITFDMPGFEGKFIRALENTNGYEMRAYTDQALFCTAPGKCTALDDVQGA